MTAQSNHDDKVIQKWKKQLEEIKSRLAEIQEESSQLNNEFHRLKSKASIIHWIIKDFQDECNDIP